MPLGEEVLVPGARLLCVRGTRRGAISPNAGRPDPKDGTGHVQQGIPEGLRMQIAPAHIQEVATLVLRHHRADLLEAGVCAQAEETQEQPALEGPALGAQTGPGLPEVPHKSHTLP
jgi:hypothetical protein